LGDNFPLSEIWENALGFRKRELSLSLSFSLSRENDFKNAKQILLPPSLN